LVALLNHFRGPIEVYKLKPQQVFELAKMATEGTWVWSEHAKIPESVLKMVVDEPKEVTVKAAADNEEAKVPQGRRFTHAPPLFEIGRQLNTVYDAMLRGGGEGEPPKYIPVALQVREARRLVLPYFHRSLLSSWMIFMFGWLKR
jgi:hypothetical protein